MYVSNNGFTVHVAAGFRTVPITRSPNPNNLTEKDAHERKAPERSASSCFQLQRQISRITGIIKGRRLVLFWMYRFRSLRIFSLITP